jgi:hypothetical protein
MLRRAIMHLYASYVQIVNRTYGRVTIMTGAAHFR